MSVPSVARIVAEMRGNPRNIRYENLAKVCEHYFGAGPNNRRVARRVQDSMAG